VRAVLCAVRWCGGVQGNRGSREYHEVMQRSGVSACEQRMKWLKHF
jgi:hypothetical protein